MITKEELTRKKAKSEQLDLVETISSVDLVRKKRRFVIFAIVATIGLSLLLWFYRTMKTVSFSVPSAPNLSLTKVSTPSLNSQILEILAKDKSKWTVDVFTDNQIKIDTSQLKTSKNSLVREYLPEGIGISELSADQLLDILITTPQKRIYVSLRYTETDPTKIKSVLSRLIPAIYWSSIQSSTN